MSFYSELIDAALPHRPLQVGQVTYFDAGAGLCTVELPGGGVIRARGAAQVDDMVFVRDGVIEGTTASLTLVTHEI